MEEEIFLSNKTRESFGIHKGVKLNSKLLEFYCNLIIEKSNKRKNAGKLFFEIEEEDIKTLQNFMDSRQADIRIDGKRILFDDDFEDYVSFVKSTNPYGLIRITNLRQLQRLGDQLKLQNCGISLELENSDFDKISIEELREITFKYKIKECEFRIDNILKADLEKASIIPNIDIYFRDSNYKESDIGTFTKIKEKMNELIKDINMEDSDLNKFTIIYKRIAENIAYDRTVSDIIELNREKDKNKEKISEESKEKINEAENLTGLISGKCVCGGFARILQCSLNSVGIDCQYIVGQTDFARDGWHAWNQVKIDGKWYNTDITWDKDSIGYHKFVREGVISKYPGVLEDLPYCLKSDEEFKHHKAASNNLFKCNESIDLSNLKKVFGYQENQRNEENNLIPYSITLWQKIKQKFKDYYNKFNSLTQRDNLNDNQNEHTKSKSEENIEKLPPWDLNNWTQEELEEAKLQKTNTKKINEIINDKEEI